MTKHTFAHLINDQFSTLHIIFGPLQLGLKLFYLIFVSPVLILQVIFLLGQLIANVLGFLNLSLGDLDLLISLNDCLSFLFFCHFDVILN